MRMDNLENSLRGWNNFRGDKNLSYCLPLTISSRDEFYALKKKEKKICKGEESLWKQEMRF